MHPSFSQFGLRLGDALAMETYTAMLPPLLRDRIERRFAADYLSGRIPANRAAAWLTDETDPAQRPEIRLAAAFEKLRDPRAAAALCKIIDDADPEEIDRIASLLGDDTIRAAIRAQGMTEDAIRRMTARSERPIAARRWLRMTAKQGIARLNLSLGLIGGKPGEVAHASPFEINLRNQQKARWQAFGERVTLTRDGQEISMATVMSAAGKKRASEIYTLSKGLEKYAEDAGLSWAFLTLTAPPRMHPNPTKGAASWDGTTPDQAHKWLHSAWRRAEARLRKAGIIVSGVRVVEPHQDGCPHWHLLVFAHPSEMPEIEEILRAQPGAEHWKEEAGLKFVLDDGRASAASYLFKYVLKTISSIEQLTGEAASVDAWRSTWAIRAFQWVGMPPVGLWRNLRALDEAPEPPHTGIFSFAEDWKITPFRARAIQRERQRTRLAGIWRAARRGDGCAFICLSGGLNVKRSERPIASKTISDPASPEKLISFLDRETGERSDFYFKKWEQKKSNENNKVAVIPNYPRNPNPQTPTPPAHPAGKEITMASTPSAAWLDLGNLENPHQHRSTPRLAAVAPPPEPSDTWLAGHDLDAWATARRAEGVIPAAEIDALVRIAQRMKARARRE